MTTTASSTARSGVRATSSGGSAVTRLVEWVNNLFGRIPNTVIAFIARFSIAAVFWNSGQTKIQGFVANLVTGEFTFGWPTLSDSAVALFQDEYKLPLIPPELAAPMAAFAEHLFPLLLYLISRGPGAFSIDHLIARRHAQAH